MAGGSNYFLSFATTVWRGQGDPRFLDRACCKVNQEMRKALEGGLGLFLLHLDIQVECLQLHCPDGIHVSEVSNDVFLADLQRAALGC